MPRCPRCGAFDVALVRRRGVFVRLAALLLLDPYHCPRCDRRFLVFRFRS